MPDYPSNSTRFLKEEETLLACNRLAVDGIALAQGHGSEEISHWKAFKLTVLDWRVWAQCFLFVLVTGSQTMQYFIPTLIKGFGWTGYTAQCKVDPKTLNRKFGLTDAIDYTIPPYLAALCYVVISAYLSDRYETKWPVCTLLLAYSF